MEMLRNLRLLSITFLFFSLLQTTTAADLSSEAKIAVMTIGPYQEELYSAFGHTAIRVVDPVNRMDLVFNYGIFDFDQANFFWNFARGKMLYQLGAARYDQFKQHYVRENRYIVEQFLNLTPAETQAIYDFLILNYQPENREYFYNYVYNNCSTKVPEILNKIFPGRINYHFYYVREGTSVRDLMHDYLKYQPWGEWIIDIGLGNQIDQEASGETYMFLPDYVMYALDSATFLQDSVTVPLVDKKVSVFEPGPESFANGVFTPFNTFVLVFFIIGFFTNRDFKREKRSHWVDVVLFTFVAIIGWWLVFLWTATDHLSKENMNLFWAIPLYIPLVYLLNIKKLQKYLGGFFQLMGAWYLLMLLLWGAIPQPINNAIIPLVLTMVLRCFYIGYDLRQRIRKPTKA